jgi:hypothetical protein
LAVLATSDAAFAAGPIGASIWQMMDIDISSIPSMAPPP